MIYPRSVLDLAADITHAVTEHTPQPHLPVHLPHLWVFSEPEKERWSA